MTRRLAPPGSAVAALFLACAGLASPAHGQERACAVSRIDGPAARAWHGGAWSPLAPGPLPRGEVKIETGPATRVGIACDDGTVVSVGVDTMLNLETLTAARDTGGLRAILQLVIGIVGAELPAGAAPVDIRAPLAIASVRSTRWLVLHGAEGSSVFVAEGAVRVRATAAPASVTLTAGQGVDVPAPGALGPVREWGDARVAEVTARLGPGWE